MANAEWQLFGDFLWYYGVLPPVYLPSSSSLLGFCVNVPPSAQSQLSLSLPGGDHVTRPGATLPRSPSQQGLRAVCVAAGGGHVTADTAERERALRSRERQNRALRSLYSLLYSVNRFIRRFLATRSITLSLHCIYLSYVQMYGLESYSSVLEPWLHYPPPTDAPHSYIPVPGSLDDYRTSALLAGAAPAAVFVPEKRAASHPYGRRNSARVSNRNSAAAARSKVPRGSSGAHPKKLRKSENQVEVLRQYFKSDAKPGRDLVKEIADVTGLSFLEVRNWFRNARLRNKDGNGYTLKGEDSCDVVSSSTEDAAIVSAEEIRAEMARLWDRLEDEDRKQMLPTFFKVWGKDSPDRTEAMKSILKCLSTTEKNFVHSTVKPRGPYRCSSDKNLSKTTILERAKIAWKELERVFGVNKREKTNFGQDCFSLNLDKAMLEGLKSLFQAHRDYLYYLVKDMGIDTSDEKDMGKLRSGGGGGGGVVTAVPARYGAPPDQAIHHHHESPVTAEDLIIPYPQYANQVDMLQGYPFTAAGYQAYPAIASTGGIYGPSSSGPAAEFSPYYPNTASYHPPLQLASPSAASKCWSTALDLDKATAASYYTPDPEQMKTEKITGHQSETKTISMKAPFGELTGGMTFNRYNSGGGEESAEITLVKTSLKYHYEVTKTFNKPSGPGAALQGTAPPALPPCAKSPETNVELI